MEDWTIGTAFSTRRNFGRVELFIMFRIFDILRFGNEGL